MKILPIFGMLLLCTFLSCSEKIPAKEPSKAVGSTVKVEENNSIQKKRVIPNLDESEAAIEDLCSGKEMDKIKLNFFDLTQQKNFTSTEYKIEQVKGECFAIIKSPYGDSEMIYRKLIAIVKN